MAIITRDRWHQAQDAERNLHTMTKAEALHHYAISYQWNFHYCGINPGNMGNKAVIEIGCADIPALYFVDNVQGMIFEPMESETLDALCAERGFTRQKELFEDANVPYCGEIWLFNVLQHVLDPERFIKKCKKYAQIVRYFEPIDTAITVYHPHSFTATDFINWFGMDVKFYDNRHECFHDGPCVYGIWHNPAWGSEIKPELQ